MTEHEKVYAVCENLCMEETLTKESLINVFDNVASMKASNNLEVGNTIKTLGYYSANDGGNGEYIIRTKTDDDEEDNGRIHFIGDDLVAELIPVNNEVNVHQFGAIGDGITDDTAAFQNAGTGAIVFDKGYLVDGSIDAKNYRGDGYLIQDDARSYCCKISKGTLYLGNDDFFDNDDNPSTPDVPRVTTDGVLNIFDGHLKFFADMDGDGDYDADMYSKDNMYLSCGNSTHFIIGQNDDSTKKNTYGRVVFAGTTNTNYIQSGKSYNGSDSKHLAFSNYKSGDYNMIFNSNTGYTGIGKYYSDPRARCHISSDENTVLILENKASKSVRLSFKTTRESEDDYLNSTIGMEDGVMVLRNNNANKLRLDSKNYVLPGIASTTNLGSTAYPWANIYSVHEVVVTSDERKKNSIKPIDEKVFEAWSNIEYKQYKLNDGDDKIHFGVIAQDIVKEFEKVGLNALDYGLVVYDEENDIYSVRYAEVNVLENAYNRYLKTK